MPGCLPLEILRLAASPLFDHWFGPLTNKRASRRRQFGYLVCEIKLASNLVDSSVLSWARKVWAALFAGLTIERKVVSALSAYRYIPADEPRPGAPRTIDDAKVEHVIVQTLESRPAGATHWSTRSMARHSGISTSSVGRIWRAFGLQPHRGTRRPDPR